MNVVFVGVQGSGKGTQAKIVAKKIGLSHISTGDLLRGATGELKEKVDEVMNSGALVSDDLMLEILKSRIEEDDCKKGIILDGFPRNLSQARLLDSELSIDFVVEIKISDEDSLKRLSGRVTCRECGEGYNVYTAPKPKDSKVCDKCGGELFVRPDDNEEAIKKRIKTYHDDTEPILEYYGDKVVKVDGKGDIDEITEDILDKLSS